MENNIKVWEKVDTLRELIKTKKNSNFSDQITERNSTKIISSERKSNVWMNIKKTNTSTNKNDSNQPYGNKSNEKQFEFSKKHDPDTKVDDQIDESKNKNAFIDLTQIDENKPKLAENQSCLTDINLRSTTNKASSDRYSLDTYPNSISNDNKQISGSKKENSQIIINKYSNKSSHYKKKYIDGKQKSTVCEIELTEIGEKEPDLAENRNKINLANHSKEIEKNIKKIKSSIELIKALEKVPNKSQSTKPIVGRRNSNSVVSSKCTTGKFGAHCSEKKHPKNTTEENINTGSTNQNKPVDHTKTNRIKSHAARITIDSSENLTTPRKEFLKRKIDLNSVVSEKKTKLEKRENDDLKKLNNHLKTGGNTAEDTNCIPDKRTFDVLNEFGNTGNDVKHSQQKIVTADTHCKSDTKTSNINIISSAKLVSKNFDRNMPLLVYNFPIESTDNYSEISNTAEDTNCTPDKTKFDVLNEFGNTGNDVKHSQQKIVTANTHCISDTKTSDINIISSTKLVSTNFDRNMPLLDSNFPMESTENNSSNAKLVSTNFDKNMPLLVYNFPIESTDNYSETTTKESIVNKEINSTRVSAQETIVSSSLNEIACKTNTNSSLIINKCKAQSYNINESKSDKKIILSEKCIGELSISSNKNPSVSIYATNDKKNHKSTKTSVDCAVGSNLDVVDINTAVKTVDCEVQTVLGTANLNIPKNISKESTTQTIIIDYGTVENNIRNVTMDDFIEEFLPLYIRYYYDLGNFHDTISYENESNRKSNKILCILNAQLLILCRLLDSANAIIKLTNSLEIENFVFQRLLEALNMGFPIDLETHLCYLCLIFSNTNNSPLRSDLTLKMLEHLHIFCQKNNYNPSDTVKELESIIKNNPNSMTTIPLRQHIMQQYVIRFNPNKHKKPAMNIFQQNKDEYSAFMLILNILSNFLDNPNSNFTQKYLNPKNYTDNLSDNGPDKNSKHKPPSFPKKIKFDFHSNKSILNSFNKPINNSLKDLKLNITNENKETPIYENTNPRKDVLRANTIQPHKEHQNIQPHKVLQELQIENVPPPSSNISSTIHRQQNILKRQNSRKVKQSTKTKDAHKKEHLNENVAVQPYNMERPSYLNAVVTPKQQLFQQPSVQGLLKDPFLPDLGSTTQILGINAPMQHYSTTNSVYNPLPNQYIPCSCGYPDFICLCNTADHYLHYQANSRYFYGLKYEECVRNLTKHGYYPRC